jgi:hypothetical protein
MAKNFFKFVKGKSITNFAFSKTDIRKNLKQKFQVLRIGQVEHSSFTYTQLIPESGEIPPRSIKKMSVLKRIFPKNQKF